MEEEEEEEELQLKKNETPSYTDEDLLVLMSYRSENEKEAKQAFEEFDSRYKGFIWSLCLQVCKNGGFGDEELAKDVFMQTRASIYFSSHTYDPGKGKIKTWISSIARNEMLDLLDVYSEKRIGEKIFVHLNEDQNIATEDNEDNYEIETPEKKILNDALLSLTEKDRDILMTYMLYNDGNRHLPDEVLNELKVRYQTTSGNIRMIKKRAMDKIEKFIKENSNLSLEKK